MASNLLSSENITGSVIDQPVTELEEIEVLGVLFDCKLAHAMTVAPHETTIDDALRHLTEHLVKKFNTNFKPATPIAPTMLQVYLRE
jgi:hypothetical protein